MTRALGVDFGEKKIGLALSDPEGRFAFPYGAVARRDDPSAIRDIALIARDERVGLLVVGEPRRLDGSRGAAAARAAAFARKLAAAAELELELVDEALTSQEAARRLREAGVDPRREPDQVHALAAQILLQEALDQRNRDR